jgi:DDE superfamily endonuclease
MSQIPRRNGWTIAAQAGDRAPGRTQRLLRRAVWDTFAAMGVVRRFAVAWLDEAACRSGRRGGLAVGAIDEPGRSSRGGLTASVKRQYLGCVGKVANGINTVHLSYVREGTGHALIGAREWIPAEYLDDRVKSLAMGLPEDLVFRTKGELAIDILAGPSPMASGWTSSAAVRCTVRAPSCASSARTTIRRTCCGSRPASAWSCQAGSRSPAAGRHAAGRQARLGGSPGRDGIKRTTLVRVGVAGHGLCPASPADPPSPPDR